MNIKLKCCCGAEIEANGYYSEICWVFHDWSNDHKKCKAPQANYAMKLPPYLPRPED